VLALGRLQMGWAALPRGLQQQQQQMGSTTGAASTAAAATATTIACLPHAPLPPPPSPRPLQGGHEDGAAAAANTLAAMMAGAAAAATAAGRTPSAQVARGQRGAGAAAGLLSPPVPASPLGLLSLTPAAGALKPQSRASGAAQPHSLAAAQLLAAPAPSACTPALLLLLHATAATPRQ
jgi:hypothetical protein